ncbi:FAD-binding domain-containing protein [Ruegeria profundi]|uniref:DNA photolyase n=1 Tax=Ruegeria profundi TaxID=1685378 RepID=A0A0X3U0D4_9RHOB|nr:FAD-binding domain-containing protein [Ruegeria profundi]KUJ81418.1 DNA photolyase [Ruegeria profundi]
MTTGDLFETQADHARAAEFSPTRQAGLLRLDQFAARTGKHYASQRNFDFGPDRRSNVSALSPWIRHRLITEQEVLNATLARHSYLAAEKFVQEVFWRTYFKGWLQQQPSVWTSYNEGLQRALDDGARTTDYNDAVEGRTGIDCFDHWVRELIKTGYLHNHTRMWFASIWVFTLRLPWELGADFFLRHLLDGDPASNTLSWRWVAGLHTKGKTYLARPSNIAKYTNGRFNPEGQLAKTAEPLTEENAHPRVPVPSPDAMPDEGFLLLVTEDDCQIGATLPRQPKAEIGLLATQRRSPLAIEPIVQSFAAGAVSDAVGAVGAEDESWAEQIIAAAETAGVKTVVTGFAPVGPVATQLQNARLDRAGLTLCQIRRDYDSLAWPHATRGFFGLKKKIPTILRSLDYAV